jgi:short-subunit dehydrogenase
MADCFREQGILITGASEGIGRELALQLAGEGARLALASRNEERLGQVVRECLARGGRALAVPTDVGAAADCRAFVEAAVREYGQVNMLINNAGISMYARFGDLKDLGLIDRIMAVNFLGAMHCTGHALPYLRQTRGRIVAVSSLAGKVIGPGGTGYVASKAALGHFFDSLRVELRSEEVSVTVAYPGFVGTEIYKRFLDGEGNFGPDKTSRIPRWAMLPVERCARRIIEAARRRRRQVPPTLCERLITGLHRAAPWLVEFFWQRTLAKDFATEPSPAGGALSKPKEQVG